MKRALLWILGIIVVIFIIAFVLLFTPFGNGILKPYIQKQINKYSPIEAKLEVFKLRFSSFDIEINALDNITINANGSYSLLGQNIDGVLNILIKNPKNIKELSAVQLSDNFAIENIIRGKFSDFAIWTKSNIADGNIDITTQIVDYSPAKILANISNLKLESMLNLIGQKPYVSGVFNLKADIVGDADLNFTGAANAEISKAKFSESLIKKDFNIKIPSTTDFVVNLNASFDGKDAKHTFNFLSQIGSITSNGSTIISELKTNSSYNINIVDLSPFSPLAGMPLRGSFWTNGKIQGNSTWLNIDGKSDFASSNTTYSVSLEQFSKPKDALVTIRNLKVDEVLYMLIMPIYTKSTMDAKIDLKQISNGISGTYSHNIKGNIQRSVLKKEFDLNPPNDIGFNHTANATLSKGSGELNANIVSDLAEMSVNKAKFNISDLSINAPYKFIVSDLKKLAFVTSKELKGNIIANGDVKYSGKKLYADLKSDIFGGNLTATLDRNIADIKLVNIKAANVLDMLQFSQFFDTNVNGKIRYDIVTQKGIMDFMANNGHFTQNQLADLLKNIVKFDITKELYESIKIDGKIDKKVVNANLNATSKNTSISSKNASLDFERDSIDAYLNLKINKDELGAKVNGKMSSPNISIDAKKAVQTIINKVLDNKKVQDATQKAKDKVEQKIGENLNKQTEKVGEKIEQKIGDTLKNLFKK